MNNKPKVSVVVPVYNAEKHLPDCINSLLKQTLHQCEFIFIDDGSTDNSPYILSKYAKIDSRIHVITQSNNGIGKARNRGIDAASGEYIGFCDNDDVVKDTMYETLYLAAVKFDSQIVISNTIFGRDGREVIKRAPFSVNHKFDEFYIKENLIPNLIEKEDLFAVWNKLYCRDFMQQYNIRFPANREIEEDAMFNISAFNNSQSAVFIDYSGYFFKEHQTSESRRLFDKDYFELALERYRFNYKEHFKLTLDDYKCDKLKAIRFIQRVFFLTFTYSTAKRFPFELRYKYSSRMIFHPEVRKISAKFKKEILNGAGHFEKIILHIIAKPSPLKLKMIIWISGVLYNPRFSEVLRYINGKK